MYSIDQGGQPIAVTSISIQGASVNFEIKPLDVTYTGTLNPEGNAIAGNATQNGHTNVLNLEHVTAENAWPIPEPPKSMAADAVPKFDVITVKPADPNRPGKGFTVRGRHVMTFNTNVNDLVTFAYSLHAKQTNQRAGMVRHRQIRPRRRSRCRGSAQRPTNEDPAPIGPDRPLQTHLPPRQEGTLRLRARDRQRRSQADRDHSPAKPTPETSSSENSGP